VHGPSTIALSVPEVGLEVRRRFLELASDAGAFCVASFVDAEIRAATEQGMLETLDLLALNESEAEVLAGCSFSPSAPREFVEKCRTLTESRYPGLKVVASVGKHGAYAFEDGNFGFCPSLTVPVASTAGAGDALLGGVISALAAGLPFLGSNLKTESWSDAPLSTALEFGVLLASYKVGSPHTIHPNISLRNLLKFAEDNGVTLSRMVSQRIVDSRQSSLASR
jgi:sugar/nucleoside kinase (ribokinase family)